MNLEEWKDKLYDSKDNGRFADFADALNVDYNEVINTASIDDKDFSTRQAKIELLEKEMKDVITDTFKYVIEDKKISEVGQIILLKLLWHKLNKIRININPENVVASLNSNKRTETANQFKSFAAEYNNPQSHKEAIISLNELISIARAREANKDTVHPAITSKKRTLISSDDATATLEKDLKSLKNETLQYIQSIKMSIVNLSDSHVDPYTDSKIKELQENLSRHESKSIGSENVDDLANTIMAAALLSKEIIELCRKHDPNRAKHFSKENTGLLSKLIEHIKSFLKTIQRQFTSKATLEKRERKTNIKNIRTQNIKHETKNILKDLETLLREIKSDTPTLNN